MTSYRGVGDPRQDPRRLEDALADLRRQRLEKLVARDMVRMLRDALQPPRPRRPATNTRRGDEPPTIAAAVTLNHQGDEKEDAR